MARYVRTQAIEHPIGLDGRVAMKVTAAAVRIHGTDAGQAVMRATFEISASSEAEADALFERSRMRVAAGSGSLAIEEANDSSLGGVIGRLLTGRGSVGVDVELELPRDTRIVLETVSGEVTVDGMRGEQRYTTTSGDIYVSDAGGALRINTVSGDVVVRADVPLSARVEAVSGDLVLSAPRLDALRAQSVSGDIEIEGELARDGEFRVETVSGDFGIGLAGSATFEVRGISTDISSDLDHRIEGRLDRRRLVIGSGEPNVIFSSMSGDISVRRQRRTTAVAQRPPAAPAEPAAEPARPMADDDQLAVLQALERGEISVDEAARRLGGGAPDA
ncbi:MAG TPA: DUF4097 family beta strand repeat-containing protein [Candidatus Limnocylindria bacterium]